MAILPRIYSTGVVAVNNGDTTVTLGGTGALWTPTNCAPSSLILIDGYFNFVASRDPSGLSLEMVLAHVGPDIAGSPYAIYPLTSNEVATATLDDRVATFIAQLNEIAGGTGIGIDAFGNYTDRATYDDEFLNNAGSKFTFLSMDGAGGLGGSVVAYVKNSATHADWSAAVVVQGIAGTSPTVTDVLDELGIHKITVSTSDPSGGQDGDIWFKVID